MASALSNATISYERANSMFRVTSSLNKHGKLVSEQTLRSIGDQDVSETMERAMSNPYEPQNVRFYVSRRRH